MGGSVVRIIVMKLNGETEAIELKGPITVTPGKVLNRLSMPGEDHFFTPAGYYDGWGKSVEVKH